MIQNYLKFAFRNLRKNATYTFLNMTGLAVGLASGILILLWVLDEFRYDRFHQNLNNLHVMMQDQTSDGEVLTFEAMPGPLAHDIKSEIPEITNATRASFISDRLIKTGDKLFSEPSLYAEPSFFEMFSFPAIQGDPKTAMGDPGSVVITERLAKKLFGTQNAIGQPIRVSNRLDYRVAAVLKDIPKNSSLKFDMALPFAIFEKNNAAWIDSYGTNSLLTWIETAPGTDLNALNAKLYNFIDGKSKGTDTHAHAWPLARYRLESTFKNGQPNGGRIDIVRMLGLLGLAIILVACINFMNLATSRSSLRAREVGVRKAVGAGKGRLIAQFLSEAMLLTFISLAVAILLARICLPIFNRVTEKEIAFSDAGSTFWWMLLGGSVLTGLVAGSYPAFFLSAFNPVQVLKNNVSEQKRGAAATLRKGLVVGQFAFSTLLIMCTIFLWLQIEHTRNRPLGFNKENLLCIPASSAMVGKFEAFKNQLQQIPGVRQVSNASDNLLNYGSNTSGMRWPGKTDDQQFLVTVTNAGAGFVQTTGLTLKEGRDFEGPQDSFAVILNESAVKRMGLKDPIGQQIQYDTNRTIVGVVKDWVQNDPSGPATPTAIVFDANDANFFFVRMENNSNWQSTMSQIQTVYKGLWPDRLYEPAFMDDACEKRFQRAKQYGFLANVFGGMSIFISCLGLFGLAAFTAERRTKEIGVRKVLGANVSGIVGMLTLDFLKLVFVAILIAIPIGMFVVNKALANIEYHIEMSPWVFVATGIGSLAIASLTVSFQSIKAAIVNPVKSLRSE